MAMSTVRPTLGELGFGELGLDPGTNFRQLFWSDGGIVTSLI